MMLNNYIAHHGVRGMKWGFRKYRSKEPLNGRLYPKDFKNISYGRQKNFIIPDGVKYNKDPNTVKDPIVINDNIKYLSQRGEEIFKKLLSSKGFIKVKDLNKFINSK